MKQLLTFKVILEHWNTRQIVFATIDCCEDMDDCITHVHSVFPEHEIEKITKVNPNER